MTIKKIILLLFISLSIFSLPIASSADGLVPCGLDSTYDNRCTLCHLFKGIENIVDWGKDILVVVALVALVAGAIMYIVSAGNNGMMESAKNVIKQALWGVVIVLGAWVIVNTSLWLIATESDLGVGVSNWYTFDCEGGGGGGDDDTDDDNDDDTDDDTDNNDDNCTSFTYSSWTPDPCTAGSTQTRTATGVPSGCTGGTPESISRNCVEPGNFSCSDNGCSQINDAVENNDQGVDANVLKTVLKAGEGCDPSLSSDGEGSCGYSQAKPDIRAWCGITGTSAETCKKVQDDVNLDVNCAAKLIKDNNRRCSMDNIREVGSCYNTGKKNNCANSTLDYCGRLESYLNNC